MGYCRALSLRHNNLSKLELLFFVSSLADNTIQKESESNNEQRHRYRGLEYGTV